MSKSQEEAEGKLSENPAGRKREKGKKDMGEERWTWLDELLEEQPGQVSCICKNLVTGEEYGFQGDLVHPSASVIKTFLMAYVFALEKEGKLQLTRQIPIPAAGLAGSCGVLSYLKDVRTLSVRDLMELMMIVSDNAATNVLADLVGIDQLQAYISENLGCTATRFQRKMMDFQAAAAGRENYTCAAETARLLEAIYRGGLVSREASAKMLRILKNQQFDDLIPFYLNEFLPEHSIAHKSGGLDGVLHDAALIDAGKEPFVLCLFGSGLKDRTVFARAIGEIAGRIYGMFNPAA